MSSEISKKKCRVVFKKGEKRAWIIEVNDASQDCEEVLKEISGDLGKHGRKYLRDRIVTSDPEVAKILQDTDLAE